MIDEVITSSLVQQASVSRKDFSLAGSNMSALVGSFEIVNVSTAVKS